MTAPTSELEALRTEVEMHRADLAEAAGELMVSVPEPGTLIAHLLIANRMMRRDRDASLNELHQIRREMVRWKTCVAVTRGTKARYWGERNLARNEAEDMAKAGEALAATVREVLSLLYAEPIAAGDLWPRLFNANNAMQALVDARKEAAILREVEKGGR